MSASAGTPGWLPSTELELLRAAENGVLDERGTGLELKQELGKGKSANTELAKDLASLAVGGGILIIGIVDVTHRDVNDFASALHPVSLDGEAERIDQVALSKCDPPLMTRCTVIESERRPGLGYLVVEVPASPQAPHMVEGRYWGRGGSTKRALGDPEVVLYHQRRELWDRDATAALAAYIERDPWVSARLHQNLAHFFFVAEPRPGHTGMALEIEGRSSRYWLREHAPAWATGFAPDQSTRRVDGWAVSLALSPGRVPTIVSAEGERFLAEVELGEGGEVRCYWAGASQLDEDSDVLLFDRELTQLTFEAARFIGRLSSATQYGGQWVLGLGVTRLRGARSATVGYGSDFMPSPYVGEEYKEVARCTTLEVQEHPGAVVYHLIGRLLRSLGSEGHAAVATFLERSS